MAANSAFSLQGATPGLNVNWQTKIPRLGSTPQSRALNTVQTGQTPTGQPPASPPAATTPLKKTTTTNVDGTSTTHEYHAPESTGMISGPLNRPNTYTQSTTGLNSIGQGGASGGVNSSANSLQGVASGNSDSTNANYNTGQARTVQGLLTNFAQRQTPEVVEKENDYNTFAQGTPYMIAAQKNPNVAADVASGRSALLGQTFGAIGQAKATAVQNALTGQGQEIGAAENAGSQALTGQGNQITAATNAGNLGVSQQNAQTSALNAAASQTHPEQLPYGTQYGTPGDLASGNTANSGGALNPLNNVQSIAQQVISGRISPSQAYAMGGNIQNWQGVLNQAIQQINPNFNSATAEGRFDANQQNTTTSGTTQANAASSSYGKAYQDVQDLKAVTQNVDTFGNLLLQSMVAPDGTKINPTDAKFANKTLSEIRGQLSSEQQSVFDSTYASLKSRVSGLLASGGAEIPTQITSDANKVLDGSLPFSSLNAVIQRISTEGKILLDTATSKLNSSGGDLGIQQSSNPTSDVTALRSKYVY